MILKNHKVNWDPPWMISIHRDFDSFHPVPVVVIGLGKNLLFKSVLAHCDQGAVLRLFWNQEYVSDVQAW